MSSLKLGTVYLLPLESGGALASRSSCGHSRPLPRHGHLPDGSTVYVATDRSGLALDGSGKPTEALEHPGAILVFTYPPEP